MRPHLARLDRGAAGHSALDVIREEVRAIDGAFGVYGRPGKQPTRRIPQDGARGGRDLRLHVAGDVGSIEGAELLAGAAKRWRARGGGSVWTFTHTWRTVPRAAWGPDISVLASVERAEEIASARRQGYAAAIVVPEHPSSRAYRLPGSITPIVPCPAETKGRTCAECRLCLDRDLMGVAIGFAAHGHGVAQVKETLVQLGRREVRA
jgi:hypothetical protein